MRVSTSLYRTVTISFVLTVAGNAYSESVYTLSNPVSNGTFQMDGSLSDWLTVDWYPEDTIGDTSVPGGRIPIDIWSGAIAHDQDFIYFLYRNAADNMVDGFSNWIFIDLDQDQSTGLNGAVNEIAGLPIGIEFNLGGTEGWNAWNPNGTHAGGAAGKTVAIGDSNISGGADFIEFAISRTAVSVNGLTFNPIGGTKFDVMFIAENAQGDYLPNSPTDWFTYNVVPEPSTFAGGLAMLAALALIRRKELAELWTSKGP